jgi:glycosyltransferase involved in cell wall biosynthesis
LRVAFVTVGDPDRLTGGYLYNKRLAEGLVENGVEVQAFVPCGAEPGDQAATATAFGDGFDPSRFDAVVVDALARVVVAPHLDRWRSGRPVVALVHELPGVADPSSDDRERLLEVPLLRSDRLVTVSRHGGEVLLGRGAPAARVRVVPPGFDNLGRHPEVKPREAEKIPRVLCVAQWIPRKGVLDLVRAWRTVGGTGAVLDLVGETGADASYAAKVREAAAGDPSITVHGPVDDATLAGLYASGALFALPSRYEGYGIVYAEALSFGLPVLACRAGPVPEVVGGQAALLVPPGDTDALSEALGRLLSDDGLREEMSAAARRRAAGLPRWKDTVEGFLAVLREAVEERGR